LVFFLVALSRNKSVEDKLFRYVILGFALTEAMDYYPLCLLF